MSNALPEFLLLQTPEHWWHATVFCVCLVIALSLLSEAWFDVLQVALGTLGLALWAWILFHIALALLT